MGRHRERCGSATARASFRLRALPQKELQELNRSQITLTSFPKHSHPKRPRTQNDVHLQKRIQQTFRMRIA